MTVLFLLGLFQTVLALPTRYPTEHDGTQADSVFSTRSTSDIFWSCITTIFACTWVAVHPNVPPAHSSDWHLFWRRVKILAVALIAPEFIIIWALNQLRSSLYGLGKLRRFDVCKHWTITHGMFLIMGGFVLIDESGQRLQILQADNLEILLYKDDVDLPRVSEFEIMDRSKGDALAKALVLIQTTWFIAQVISRAMSRLHITELELATVAFAFLNFLTYALWWKKPLDARHPIFVTLRCRSGQAANPPTSITLSPENFQIPHSSPTTTKLEVTLDVPLVVETIQTIYTMGSCTLGENKHSSGSPDDLLVDKVCMTNLKQESSDDDTAVEPNDGASKIAHPGHELTLSSSNITSAEALQKVDRVSYSSTETLDVTSNSVFIMATSLVRSLAAAYKGVSCGFLSPTSLLSKEEEVHVDNVPTFYAGALGDIPCMLQMATPPRSALVSSEYLFWVREWRLCLGRLFLPAVLEMLIGALFGSIHCVAWGFEFPSKAEQMIWRITSVCITVFPVVIAIVLVTAAILSIWKRHKLFWCRKINVVILPLYVLSRLVVLVMAFVLLRDLPDTAFKVVRWTTFIPHI